MNLVNPDKWFVLWFAICLNLWIGRTIAQQESQLPSIPELTTTYTSHTFVPNDIFPQEILEDRFGQIWVLTNYGLRRYDGSKWYDYFHTGDTSSISDNYTVTVYEDHAGNLWFGTRNNGIDLYDRESDSFIRGADPVRNDIRIWSFLEVNDSIVWVGARDYLIRLNWSDASCTYFDLPKVAGKANAIRDLIYFRNDSTKLWCGTVYGLLSFDCNAETFQKYPMPRDWVRPGMPGEEVLITGLEMDQHGDNIWCGTWGHGMANYDVSTGVWSKIEFKPHTEADKWDQVVHEIARRDDDNIWITSSHGIAILNTPSEQIHELPIGGVGQIADAFSYSGIGLFTSGRVAFTGVGNFNSSEPLVGFAGRGTERTMPEVNLIEVNGVEVASGVRAGFVYDMQLTEDEKDIRIGITLPGAFQSDSILYAFKLEAYDHDWQVSERNSVRYTNLGGGTYTLKYRTSKNGSEWVEGRTELLIDKRYPLWGHPAIITTLVLLGAGFVVVVFALRVRSIKRTARLKTEYETRIAGIEMAALRAQMNPHFMFNSLNAIKTYILKENPKAASEYLTKFSQLMRAVLKNSKEKLITLEEELHALKLYIELEMLRFTDDFDWDMKIDPRIKSDQVMIPPLLLQPYVENAIRHGLLPKQEGARHLNIEIRPVDDGRIEILITDSGIGRAAAGASKKKSDMNRKSMGMSITNDRIQLIEQTMGIKTNVDITDLYKDDVATGTKVRLTIPLILNEHNL